MALHSLYCADVPLRNCSLTWWFELYCIIGLTCMLASPLRLQWVLVIAILSTPLSACVVIVLLTCIDLYSCLVLLHCIAYLHISPQSTVSTGFTLLLTHMSACDCISLAGRTIYLYCYCVLLLACYHWHWHLLLILCLLPQLLRAVAPAPTLITTF